VQAFIAVGLGVAILPHLALTFVRPGLHRARLTVPPVRHITAARLAASYRSAATTSMLSVLRRPRMPSPRRGPGPAPSRRGIAEPAVPRRAADGDAERQTADASRSWAAASVHCRPWRCW
jgi:hypothetical protein